jgi:chromosome segregation ATPase
MINEQHRAPMTLARLKAVAASPNGFETVTPQGARQLLEEIAGQPEAPKGQEPGDLHWHPDLLTPEQTALVQELTDALVSESNDAVRLTRALAAAKAEAHSREGALRATCDALDAAKARIAEVTLAKDTFFDALQKANARADAAERDWEQDVRIARDKIEELQRAITAMQGAAGFIERDQLAARVTELARQAADSHGMVRSLEGALDAANARADEAERELRYRRRQIAEIVTKLDSAERYREREERSHRDSLKRWQETIAERDQLAARLKLEQSEHSATLELWAVNRRELEAKQCTPEERAVLGAWGLLSDSALEHLRVNGSIPLSNIAVTELANRAAKAKAGA